MPATKIPILTLSFPVWGDVAAHQPVEIFFADGKAHVGPPQWGGPIIGVAQEAGTQGEMISVDVLGTTVAIAGGAIAAFDQLGISAQQTLVPLAVDAAKVGVALQPAAEGELFEVLLTP